MILKFRYVPLKDKRYTCIDCMHLEIDTDKKTYIFFEDQEPGEGISIKLKSDIVSLLNLITENGFHTLETELCSCCLRTIPKEQIYYKGSVVLCDKCYKYLRRK